MSNHGCRVCIWSFCHAAVRLNPSAVMLSKAASLPQRFRKTRIYGAADVGFSTGGVSLFKFGVSWKKWIFPALPWIMPGNGSASTPNNESRRFTYMFCFTLYLPAG